MEFIQALIEDLRQQITVLCRQRHQSLQICIDDPHILAAPYPKYANQTSGISRSVSRKAT
ncbi:hypothetical protein BJQ90_00399 [Arthrobacter sp. SO3]|nr:hypothetical protein [Arthrobacter sp. SO3]